MTMSATTSREPREDGAFFYTAHRMIEADRKRQATMAIIPDASPPVRRNGSTRSQGIGKQSHHPLGA
jgi:hypothetical protein